MGMANSLEVRVPFLDREVLELAETLPLKYKVRAPKTKVALQLLRQSDISEVRQRRRRNWDSQFRFVYG